MATAPAPPHPAAAAAPRLVTLVYCLRDGQVLLLQRANPPFPGLWVAPGGKVEPGEGPAGARSGSCGRRPACAPGPRCYAE